MCGKWIIMTKPNDGGSWEQTDGIKAGNKRRNKFNMSATRRINSRLGDEQISHLDYGRVHPLAVLVSL